MVSLETYKKKQAELEDLKNQLSKLEKEYVRIRYNTPDSKSKEKRMKELDSKAKVLQGRIASRFETLQRMQAELYHSGMLS